METARASPPARAPGTPFRTSVFGAAAGVAVVGLFTLAAVILATMARDARSAVDADAELVAHLLAVGSADGPSRLSSLPPELARRVCVYDAGGAQIAVTPGDCPAVLSAALADDSFLSPAGTAAIRLPAAVLVPAGGPAATLVAEPGVRGAVVDPGASRSPGVTGRAAVTGRATVAATVVVAMPKDHVIAAVSEHLLSFVLASLLLAGSCMLIAVRYVTRHGAEIGRVRDAANAMRAGTVVSSGARPRIIEFAELLDAITDTTRAAQQRIGDAEREIAERQRAEAALVASENRIRRVIDEVPQALFAVTREGQLLLANQRLAALYGATPPELLRDPSPLFADPWLTSAPTVVIGHGTSSRVLEVHRVPFPLGGPPDSDADGAAPGTLVVGNDVTEARHLQMQLNQASRMQAIGQLAGGIAHEFNNLLTPINGHAELLRARLNDPDLQRPLDAITSAATRARQLIRQVLSFSRTTEQLFERTPTAIGAVIEEVALLMRGSLPASIEFRVQIELALPHVLADTGQLHQVLVNLCTNAAHAIASLDSGRIGGRIDVIADAIHADDVPSEFARRFSNRRFPALQSTDEPMSGVRIRVLDNGAGMAPEVMSRVFDPFFSTKPGDRGTGLGLAVAKGIVEAHGGQIRVDSSPGWATCFEILLPGIHTEPAGAAELPAIDAAPAAKSARRTLAL